MSEESLPSVAASDPPGDPSRSHIRGSALLLAGRMISLGLNLVVQVLVVRYLSKHDYGSFAFAIAMVAIASKLSVGGLGKTLSRFMPIYHEQGDYAKMFGGLLLMFGIVLGVGVSIVLAVYGAQGVLAEHLVSDPISLTVLLVMISLAPVNALDSLLQSTFAVFASAWSIFFRRHVLAPGLKLAVVLLVILAEGDVYLLAFGYLAAGALGIAIYGMLMVHLLRREGMFSQMRSSGLDFPARELLGFSIPLLSSDLAFLLRGAAVIVMLEFFLGSDSVAEFRSVLPIARLNEVVLTSFTFLFIPAASRLFVREQWQQINQLYWRSAVWILVLTFPVFAVTCALADPLAVLLFGERYAASGSVLAVLALGFFFNASLGLNARTLKVYGKLRVIVLIDLVATALALVLSLLLIPRYGALGAAIGACATLVVYNMLNQIALATTTHVRWFPRHVVKVYLASALAALALVQIQWRWSPPLYVSFPLASLASLAVLATSRHQLDVENTFPGLLRLRVLRWFFTTTAEDSGPSWVQSIEEKLSASAASYFADLTPPE